MKSRPRVLHVFKDVILDPKHFYLGSTKDIRCRTAFFDAARIDYQELSMDQNDEPDRFTLEALRHMALDPFRAILFEHTIFPKSAAYIKTTHPHLRILVRSHNAEFYHRLHYALGALKYSSVMISLRWLAHSIQKYREDKLCARYADYILSISEWESRHYWPRFAAPEKIKTAPFFLSDPYLQEIRSRSRPKSNLCVCLTSTVMGPFLYDALHHFQKMAAKTIPRLRGWEFHVTGRIPKKWRKRQQQIIYGGLMESPLDILNQARAMCILSDLGFGFKTKILESIMCGCYVLVPPKLYRRLPEVIKPFCHIINLKDHLTFREALAESTKPLPEIDPNRILKRIADNTYTSVFQDL